MKPNLSKWISSKTCAWSLLIPVLQQSSLKLRWWIQTLHKGLTMQMLVVENPKDYLNFQVHIFTVALHNWVLWRPDTTVQHSPQSYLEWYLRRTSHHAQQPRYRFPHWGTPLAFEHWAFRYWNKTKICVEKYLFFEFPFQEQKSMRTLAKGEEGTL